MPSFGEQPLIDSGIFDGGADKTLPDVIPERPLALVGSFDEFLQAKESMLNDGYQEKVELERRLAESSSGAIVYLGSSVSSLLLAKDRLLGVISLVRSVKKDIAVLAKKIELGSNEEIKYRQFAPDSYNRHKMLLLELNNLADSCDKICSGSEKNIVSIDKKIDEQKTSDTKIDGEKKIKIGKEFREQMQLIHKFWPEGVTSHFKQGKIGDCYLLAALYCIKNHKDGASLLAKIIDEDKTVHFFDKLDGQWESEQVTDNDLNEPEYKKRGVTGALGDRVIERAFTSYIHHKSGGQTGETIINFRGIPRQRLAVDGGYVPEALYYLVGRDFKKQQVTEKSDMKAMFEVIARDCASGEPELMVTAASKSEEKFPKKMFGIFLRKKVLPRHAYAITDVHIEAGTVTLVDPHDTSQKLEMAIDDFYGYFTALYVVQRAKKAREVNDRTLIGAPTLV